MNNNRKLEDDDLDKVSGGNGLKIDVIEGKPKCPNCGKSLVLIDMMRENFSGEYYNLFKCEDKQCRIFHKIKYLHYLDKKIWVSEIDLFPLSDY